jgi:hypothetical protein
VRVIIHRRPCGPDFNDDMDWSRIVAQRVVVMFVGVVALLVFLAIFTSLQRSGNARQSATNDPVQNLFNLQDLGSSFSITIISMNIIITRHHGKRVTIIGSVFP